MEVKSQSFSASEGPLSLIWHQIPVPTPFPVGPVNVYLVEAEPLTLIDTGPNTPAAREALTSALGGLGFTPGDIKRVLVTHGHGDHAGLAGWLQEQGAEVYLHPWEAAKLNGRDVLAMGEVYFRHIGIPGDLLDALRPMVRYAVRYNGELGVYNPLHAGEEIPFAGFHLSVLDTPGHCGGHLAFYQPQLQLMFTGDTVLKEISPNPLPEPQPESTRGRSGSLAAFLSTLERLEGLPVRWVMPGHGEIMEGYGWRIDAMREHHRQRVQYLYDLLDNWSTPYELSTRLYGSLAGWDVLLGASEVCAHLDLMADRGLVEEQVGADGVFRYARIPR